jgi:predicted nucleic acid-binding protein
MLDRTTVLDIDIETTGDCAAIRLELKCAGKPIPANDLWRSDFVGLRRQTL